MMDFRDTEGTGENMATDAIEAATQAMASVAKAKPRSAIRRASRRSPTRSRSIIRATRC